MKQGIGKIVDLHILLLNSAELPNDESDLETFGREQYSNLFLTNAICGFHLLHDGEQARFARGRFKHAFSKADEWQSSDKKTSLDKRRIARIEWILPIIKGQVSGTECWLVKEDGVEKRIYVSFGQGYVIWFESSGNEKWEFSTAYTANAARLREYTVGGKKIWKFGQ